MKDFDAMYKEWGEVAEEYFSKELEKNMAQHRADDKKYKYKLNIYQKTFLDFVCGSPTSIETSCQNEENEARPNGQLKRRRCKLRNH